MIPPDVANLGLRDVRQVNDNEWSAACPKCGGERHRNGSLPDRFRVWSKSRVTGGVLGWCRQCGYTWTPRGERLDPALHDEWIKERKQVEEDRKSEAERALELLHREQVWLRYHDNLTGELRQYYYDRGLEDYWIDYWCLGYNPAKNVWDGDGGYTTPTLTIPIYEPGQVSPITIRNRLLKPRKDGDKYRPEFGKLPTGLFYCDRDCEPTGKALIVEGEFKAMTTYLALDDPEMFVVGTPGKTPSPELFGLLDDCSQVYILLDPDAYRAERVGGVSAVRRMIDIFKDRARVIRTPGKVDDMITAGHLGKDGLRELVRGARRIRL